ncbi:MAG: prolyl oligopeptidase family serine peptidase [Planctomycetales bacterium]|nr:prolyl oligopeptidase family serine peptidase [Planctomycetales bacterium]
MRNGSLPNLIWGLVGLLFASGARAEESPRQHAERLETTSAVTLNYLLALPKNYESNEKWPLLLFLHGSGERGDDLDKVKIHGPPKLIAAGQELPMIVVSPQCPSGQRWQSVTLLALLDDVAKRYKVDPDRVYVTGLSMGGFGTWGLAADAPDRFAAIAPICGGGEVYWAKQIAHLPIWAFHGAKDRAVPVERSEQMIEAVRKAGGEPQLTIYPEAGHDAWTETYENDDFYAWLLRQKRTE